MLLISVALVDVGITEWRAYPVRSSCSVCVALVDVGITEWRRPSSRVLDDLARPVALVDVGITEWRRKEQK